MFCYLAIYYSGCFSLDGCLLEVGCFRNVAHWDNLNLKTKVL